VSTPGFGALVISLDFEIHWGVRELTRPDGAYRANLIGAREAIPEMLALFREFDVAATWATVGMLFAGTRNEQHAYWPRVQPGYDDPRLSSYTEPVGENETVDPFHFGATLVERIRQTPRQELATHTFGHYYCLEPGQTAESFAADLESAIAIARDRGLEMRSLVFPGNQDNPAYHEVARKLGIRCYRGNPPQWVYRGATIRDQSFFRRTGRLVDAFFNITGDQTFAWEDVRGGTLPNVRGSFFLRPTRPVAWRQPIRRLQFRRIAPSIREAGRRHRLVHLWWHPHNFGRHVPANIAELRRYLEVFADARSRYGMRSMTMLEAAETAGQLS
jgi:hypothetical protein